MAPFAGNTLVIGAGVIGLACAAAIARRGGAVMVVEAEGAIGTGISSRSSEIVHGGMYYAPDTLKARHCLRGRRMLYEYAEQHGIRYQKIGKLIVANNERERDKIEEIYAQGVANHVEGIELIGGATAKLIEPNLRCLAAVLSPESGIIDSYQLMLSLRGELEDHGGMIGFHTRIQQLVAHKDGWTAVYQDDNGGGRLDVKRVINAAGLGAQKIARYTQGYPHARIPELHMAKGQYFSCKGKPPFSRLVYPAPVDGGLGVHLTFDLDGRMKFGPDVEWVDEENYEVDASRVGYFYARIRTYWPDLPEGALTPDYAGIRPKLTGPNEPPCDFIIDGPEDHELKGLVHLFGIESPGLTACLSIARRVAKIIEVNEA
jgi:L-2-hydroxyglutarate oxidase LhgO